MKEKISILLKRPLFLVATGSMLLVVIFGILAIAAVPRQPQVVKRFCRALERQDEKAMLRCIYEDSDMYKYSVTPEQIVSMINPETNTVKCLIGQAVPYENDRNSRGVLVCMCIYEEGQLKKLQILQLGLEKVNGREYIGDILGIGNPSGLLGGSGGKLYAVHADVDTKIYGVNNIQRTIRIEYNRLATEVEMEWVADVLGEEERKFEQKYNVKISKATEADVSVLYITQEGSQQDVARSSRALFDAPLGMVYLHDGRPFRISNMIGFQQYTGLGDYTLRKAMDERVSYSFTFSPGTMICDVDNDWYDRYEINGATLSLEKGDQDEMIPMVAKKINLRGICFWIAFITFVISGGLYMYQYQVWRSIPEDFFKRIKKELRKVPASRDASEVNHQNPTPVTVIKEEELENLDIDIEIQK